MNTFFYYLIAFALALGFLIVFHELGHYLVARLCGVKVLRFSIGFGRALIRKRIGKDKTEWVLAAFPLGGYVKMVDEREGDVTPEDAPFAFNRQSVYRRFAIVVAGPAANFLLAIALYWGLFAHGVPGLKPVLGDIAPNTPAAMAGFNPGEIIFGVGGDATATWQEVRWKLLDHAMERGNVDVEVRSEAGRDIRRRLDLSKIASSDLEGDFVSKLGFAPRKFLVPAVVGSVLPNGSADRAGVIVGDKIVMINGAPISDWNDLVLQVSKKPGIQLYVELNRRGKYISRLITPNAVNENGVEIGRIGISVADDGSDSTRIAYGIIPGFFKALTTTWEYSVFSLKTLYKMLVGQVSVRNISGPITIADYAGQSARMGLAAYLTFLAIVSVSLGVLNLLPIPVLDGGHLMYYICEFVKGSPVSDRAMQMGQQFGIGILGILMVFAIYNDINRLFPG